MTSIKHSNDENVTVAGCLDNINEIATAVYETVPVTTVHVVTLTPTGEIMTLLHKIW